MTRLLLLRHAESEWNAQGRWQGHGDSPLTARGRRHATQAGGLLAAFEMLVCSDLARARQSADIIAAGAGIDTVHVEPRLRERDAGPWEGLTRAEIEEGWPGFVAGGRRPAGYETDDILARRVDAALRDIAIQAAARASTGASRPPPLSRLDDRAARSPAGAARAAAGATPEVLVITHGGVIHNLVIRAGATMVAMPNLSGRWVTVLNGAVSVGEPVEVGAAAEHSSGAIEAGIAPAAPAKANPTEA